MLTALRRNAARLRRLAAEGGWARVVAACARWPGRYLLGIAGLSGRGSFEFSGRSLDLLRHPYHYTWLNERAVEVPIFRELLRGHSPARVLEVGNVLAHYGRVAHLVVDRYERAPGVVNEDVVTFEPDRDFDLILSISTLEHVGVDEEPRDPDKAGRAVGHLRGLLSPTGRLVFSIPAGAHSRLERALASRELELEELRALRRERGRWLEVEPSEVVGIPYDRLLYEAGAVLVATAGPAGRS